MFDIPVDELDARQTLADAVELQTMSNLIEARILSDAAHWADLHAVVEDSSTLPGCEELVQLGGDGTPEVAEFAPAEFGAAIGISDHAASMLVGDALDLRHRLPLLWGRVQAGEVKAWAARQVAQTTRPLSVEAAAQVDRMITPYADRKTARDLVKIAEAETLRTDPEYARQRAEAARTGRGVWVSHDTVDGLKDVFIRADAVDVTRLDHSLNLIAADLKTLGDDSPQDERRAKAVGVLAHPQYALSLHADATGGAAPGSTATGLPSTTLYVHLTDHTLTDRAGVARVEGIGPVLASQLKDLLGHDRVTIKPVIDLPNQAPVDAYEIPDRLREAVHLTTPTDVFPYGSNKTRHQDIDHTIPYDPNGPPGQTRTGNLAPLTRRHHRIKTHGRWKMKQPFPGIIIWQSPQGIHYLIDNTGTRRIHTA